MVKWLFDIINTGRIIKLLIHGTTNGNSIQVVYSTRAKKIITVDLYIYSYIETYFKMLIHIYHPSIFIVLMNIYMQVNAQTPQNVDATEYIEDVSQCWSGVKYEKWSPINYSFLAAMLSIVGAAFLSSSPSKKRTKGAKERKKKKKNRYLSDSNEHELNDDRHSKQISQISGDFSVKHSNKPTKRKLSNSAESTPWFLKGSNSHEDLSEYSDEKSSAVPNSNPDQRQQAPGKIKGNVRKASVLPNQSTFVKKPEHHGTDVESELSKSTKKSKDFNKGKHLGANMDKFNVERLSVGSQMGNSSMKGQRFGANISTNVERPSVSSHRSVDREQLNSYMKLGRVDKKMGENFEIPYAASQRSNSTIEKDSDEASYDTLSDSHKNNNTPGKIKGKLRKVYGLPNTLVMKLVNHGNDTESQTGKPTTKNKDTKIVKGLSANLDANIENRNVGSQKRKSSIKGQRLSVDMGANDERRASSNSFRKGNTDKRRFSKRSSRVSTQVSTHVGESDLSSKSEKRRLIASARVRIVKIFRSIKSRIFRLVLSKERNSHQLTSRSENAASESDN